MILTKKNKLRDSPERSEGEHPFSERSVDKLFNDSREFNSFGKG